MRLQGYDMTNGFKSLNTTRMLGYKISALVEFVNTSAATRLHGTMKQGFKMLDRNAFWGN